MKIPLFYVDAFTSEVFKGNPAAVCLLESWLPDEVLQSIATEHNLSETAFVVRQEKEMFQLKWFTPRVEVDLCGHATLAAAHVLFSIYNFGNKPIQFKTKSGILLVTHTSDGKLTLDFPAYQVEPGKSLASVSEALGKTVVELYTSRNQFLAVLNSEKDILALSPDFEKLKELDEKAVIVTAPGKDCDFVSRFFAPKIGINEDPVTGSAHCSLIPYWSKRLKKDILHAIQLSERTGELWCTLSHDRVLISGNAITYMQGTIGITITPPSNLVAFT
ncbi:MAG TPA: PhzF family phenazine biosynthesis protein [Bacteroidales bacterium]